MASRRDVILDAMVALLGTGTVNGHAQPAGLTVSRQRTLPLDASQLPAQAVYLIDEEISTGPGRGPSRLARRKMRVCVEHRCVVTTTADQDVDPLISWSVQALCANPQLATGVHDIQEMGTVWDQTDSSLLGAARTMFLVDYLTAATDPDAVA